MANPVKGEVGFEADGQSYVFLLDFNALCDLEEGGIDLMNGAADLTGLRSIRKVFTGGLRARHPDIDERTAGALIHAIGIDKVTDILQRAIEASFPEAKKPARPPKAPANAGALNAH